MFVYPGSQRRWVARSTWAPFGVNLLLLFLLLAELCPAVAQTVEGSNSNESQSPNQLRKTAESYEKFLREPPVPGDSQSRVEVQARLGAVYFLLHRYRDSLEVLRPVLRAQLPSKHSEVVESSRPSLQAQSWLVRGLDYLGLNQVAEAIPALRRALATLPGSANARLALGDALARGGRMEDAAKEYAAQTRLTASLPDAWYKLGLAHSQISVDISRAEVRPLDKSITQQLAAEELMAKGDNLNAARNLLRLLHQAPTHPEVHAELGTALLDLGYAKAAEDHFRQELVTNPESPLSRLGLAQTGALRGDWEQANEQLEHLSRSQPHEITRLLEFPPSGLILQAWNGGRMKPSEKFNAAGTGILWRSWLSDSHIIARISPNGNGDSRQVCGGAKATTVPGIWLTQQCYESLVRQFGSKTGLAPAMRAKLAEGEFRLGQYDAALRTAKLLHAADRHSGWGVYWLSKVHDAIAEECFLKVGSLNPDSARVHQMLAEHYSKLSDYPKAKAEYLGAIRLAPSLPDLHLGLGTVLSRTGEWTQAEREFKTTLQLAPESDFAHYQLGHVYIQQSLWQQAVEQLRQVSDSSTALLSARLDLAKAESEMGQTPEAIQDVLSVAALDRDGEVYFDLAALYRKVGDEGHAREALASFKRLRAASLQADEDELGTLEREQGSGHANSP